MHISRAQRGFTLIELLVVIAIIGILSSVVLASLNTARLKSRDARRISDIKQLQIALALYADANSSVYPTTLAALAPTYIPVLPTDPSGGAAYKYSALHTGVPATCSSYHLGATLEDSTNQALGGDPDAAVSTKCTGASNDFAGASAACTVTVGADSCYDVKP